MRSKSKFDSAREIANEIMTTLALEPEQTRAVVLAELLGSFLAGYVVESDPQATMIMRLGVLHTLIDTAQALVEAGDEHRIAGHA